MAVAIVAPVVAAVVAPVPTPFPAGLAPVAAIVPTVTPPLPAILAPVLPCFAAIPAPLAIVLAQLALVARLVLGGLSAIAGDDVLRAAARYLATLANLPAQGDRKSVVSGKSVSVRLVLGCARIIKKKNKNNLLNNT